MSNSTNHTRLVSATLRPERQELQVNHVMFITVAVAAFLANSMLCLIHACCKRLQRSSNIFLITHFTANTVQTLASMMCFAFPNIGDVLVCVLNIAFCLSILSVPVITLVTLIKTLCVTRYTAFISGKLPLLLLTLLVFLALGVAVPPFVGLGSPVLFYEHSENASVSYAVSTALILSVIPLVIICTSNYRLFKRVRSYEQSSRRESVPQVHRGGTALQFDIRRREDEAKWIMLLQVVAFFVCLIPIAGENIVSSFLPRIMPAVVGQIFNCLAQAYCLFSPLLYGFSNREVRQAFKFRCTQKKFVLHGSRLERRKQRVPLGEGRYLSDRNGGRFVVPRLEQSCDALELNCAGPERLVRFTGVSLLSVDYSVDANDSRPQKPVNRGKRPITTEVSPLRRHSTLRRNQEGPSTRQVNDRVKVRFDSEYSDRQRKKYIATPSIKRMRQIKRCMSDISLDDLQTSVTGSEFESQQHMMPHYTNYSDPMRSAGFRQVLTKRGKTKRACSLYRGRKHKPKTKNFMERRCSIEADYAIKNKCCQHGNNTVNPL